MPLLPVFKSKFRAATVQGPWLFPAKGNPDEHVRKPDNEHAAALKRSGVTPPFRLHDLRHTAATRMGEAASTC